MFFYSWLFFHDPFWTALPAVAAIAFLVPRFFPTKKRLASLAAKTPGSLGERLTEISLEWFFEKTVVSETKRAWSAFDSLDEDANYLYFFISKTHAYVIPKRAFSSLAAAQAFLDKARHYRDAALSGQTLPDEAPADNTGIWPPPRPAAAN